MSSTGFTGKRIFVLRHAATMPNSGGEDIDRPLTPKGREDALALGKVMQQKEYKPNKTLCSPALRTRQTLEELQQYLDTPNTDFPKILYDGSTGDYLYEIQQVSEDYQNILMIAHNPSIYELIYLIAAQGHDSVIQRLSGGYKPATLSIIHCKCDQWKDIQPAENEIVNLMDPLDYNAPARPTRWM